MQEAETAGVPVPADGYVFSSDFGYGPLDLYTVSKFVKRVGDRCGIPVHTHSLRHFATSNAIAAGYDVAIVAERMGDSACRRFKMSTPGHARTPEGPGWSDGL